MFTDNFQEDREFLETQIVLTLENEGYLHKQVSGFISAGNFNAFRTLLFNTSMLDRVMSEADLTSATNLKSSTDLRYIPWAKSQVSVLLWQRMRVNAGLDPDSLPSLGAGTYKESLALLSGEDKRVSCMYSSVPFKVFQPEVSQPEPEKEIIMANTNTPFETINFTYGVDISTMTEDQLIANIKRAEGEIAQLGTVKAASKKLATKKADLEVAIAKMVEVLDAK